MKVVNPEWKKAVAIGVVKREITKNEMFDKSGCNSRVYGSAVINGRSISQEYAAKISKFLEITEPYMIEIPEAQIS